MLAKEILARTADGFAVSVAVVAFRTGAGMARGSDLADARTNLVNDVPRSFHGLPHFDSVLGAILPEALTAKRADADNAGANGLCDDDPAAGIDRDQASGAHLRTAGRSASGASPRRRLAFHGCPALPPARVAFGDVGHAALAARVPPDHPALGGAFCLLGAFLHRV